MVCQQVALILVSYPAFATGVNLPPSEVIMSRGVADKAAYLMGWKSPYRQLPDSDG